MPPETSIHNIRNQRDLTEFFTRVASYAYRPRIYFSRKKEATRELEVKKRNAYANVFPLGRIRNTNLTSSNMHPIWV